MNGRPLVAFVALACACSSVPSQPPAEVRAAVVVAHELCSFLLLEHPTDPRIERLCLASRIADALTPDPPVCTPGPTP